MASKNRSTPRCMKLITTSRSRWNSGSLGKISTLKSKDPVKIMKETSESKLPYYSAQINLRKRTSDVVDFGSLYYNLL